MSTGPSYREVAEFFDGFAADDERWRQTQPRLPPRWSRTSTGFHVPPGRCVLEIGCGSGDLLAALAAARRASAST